MLKKEKTNKQKVKATKYEEIMFAKVYKGFEVMESLLNGKDVFVPQWMYLVTYSEVDKHV